MLPFADVNVTAVVAATVASMALGFLWYGPLFGEKWMKLVGLTKKDCEGGAGKAMIMGLLTAFVTIYSLALVLALVSPANLQDGMLVGGVLWLGFTAMNEAGSAIWAKGPWDLVFLNSAYSLVMTLLSVAILMSWA